MAELEHSNETRQEAANWTIQSNGTQHYGFNNTTKSRPSCEVTFRLSTPGSTW